MCSAVFFVARKMNNRLVKSQEFLSHNPSPSLSASHAKTTQVKCRWLRYRANRFSEVFSVLLDLRATGITDSWGSRLCELECFRGFVFGHEAFVGLAKPLRFRTTPKALLRTQVSDTELVDQPL
jgi:hypothetical protein